MDYIGCMELWRRHDTSIHKAVTRDSIVVMACARAVSAAVLAMLAFLTSQSINLKDTATLYGPEWGVEYTPI